MPAFLAPLLKVLAANGLSMLAGAIQAKGKEVIEEKLGVKIPDDPKQLTPELMVQLKTLEINHQEFLVSSALEEKKLDIDLEKHSGTQVSDRWKFDMNSDSWLSKNIRPLALGWLLVLITGMVIADACGMRFQERIAFLVEMIAQLILGAYFLGRSAEKITSVVKGKK